MSPQECTCGFGVSHDDINPRCELNMKKPTTDDRSDVQVMNDVILNAIAEWGREEEDSDLTFRIRKDLIAAGFRRLSRPAEER